MITTRTRNLTNGFQFFRQLTTSEQAYAARPRIKHYIISRGQDSDYFSILSEILKVVNSSKDSIIFLTQKSRVLVTQDFDSASPGRPATSDEIHRNIFEQSFKTVLTSQNILPLFRPDPGHVCLTLTDSLGSVEEHNTVSLRHNSKRRIAEGKSDLHPRLYGNFTGAIYHSQHTSFYSEAEKLARTVSNPHSSVVADITVVPFSSTEITRKQFISNIATARKAPIYNLCKAIFKQKLIENSNDISIQSCLNEMKHVTNSLKLKNVDMLKSDEAILAAFACTNAAVEACFGDPHFLARNVRLDLSTQATVTLCCAMSIVGEQEFFKFARNLGFYDDSTALLEGVDDDKIINPRR